MFLQGKTVTSVEPELVKCENYIVGVASGPEVASDHSTGRLQSPSVVSIPGCSAAVADAGYHGYVQRTRGYGGVHGARRRKRRGHPSPFRAGLPVPAYLASGAKVISIVGSGMHG